MFLLVLCSWAFPASRHSRCFTCGRRARPGCVRNSCSVVGGNMRQVNVGSGVVCVCFSAGRSWLLVTRGDSSVGASIVCMVPLLFFGGSWEQTSDKPGRWDCVCSCSHLKRAWLLVTRGVASLGVMIVGVLFAYLGLFVGTSAGQTSSVVLCLLVLYFWTFLDSRHSWCVIPGRSARWYGVRASLRRKLGTIVG